jgi:hypothetical protein
MWIGAGVVKVLFFVVCGRNWSCEDVVCWCVKMCVVTGVVKVLFVGVWKCGLELEL